MPRTDPTPGELVHTYRVEKNWSRARLANEMHKSVSWVSQIERGELPLTDVTVLGRFAVLFAAPIQEFIDAALGPDSDTIRERPYIEQLRLSITGHPAPDRIAATAWERSHVDLAPLLQRTAHVWERLHRSAYRELGPMIATLVTDLEVATRTCPTDQRRDLLLLLAQTYQAAAAMLVKVGDRGAGWVAADRAIAAGERCHDPALILAGQLRMARTLLDSQEQSLACHVLTQAVHRTNAIVTAGDPGEISLVGSCALLLAVLRARQSNTDAAEQGLTVARRLAAEIGDDLNHHDTEFGPTNVAMHAVAVAVELGNGQQALDRTKHVHNTGHMSLERQARYLVDVARAHVLTRSCSSAVHALVTAEQIAPEELAESPRVSSVIDDIEALAKPKRIPGLRELRQRLYG